MMHAGSPSNRDKNNDVQNVSALINILQPDSSGHLSRQPAINSESVDNKDGDKKKMKIVFINDTIKEMTVNGKPVSKEDMKEYADEIRKMQEELASSQNDLEKVNEQLKEAQAELEVAQREIGNDNEDLYDHDFRDLNRQIQGALSQGHINTDVFKYAWQNEEFREQMKKAQEEAKKAFEEMKEKQQEYWFQHQDEWKEQMKKAQEAAIKAFEELRKNKEFHFYHNDLWPEPEPCLPVMPGPPLPAMPHLDNLNPMAAPAPLEIIPEEHHPKSQSDNESLDSKLRELEKEEMLSE
jgi:chromosome segregation ATPase